MNGDFISKLKVPVENNRAPVVLTDSGQDQSQNQGESVRGSSAYIAYVVTFGLLFLSVLGSVLSLITFVVDKWLITPKKDSYDVFDFSSFESYAVVLAMSTLLISLPALVVLVAKIRKLESDQPWRNQQKWRRIVYTILSVILILTLVSTVISVVFEVLSVMLKLSELGYNSYYDTAVVDAGEQLRAAALSGFVNALVVSLALATILLEYSNRARKLIWATLTTFAILGLITGVISIGYINKAVAEAKKSQQNQQVEYGDGYNSSSDSFNAESSSRASSPIKTDLETVKTDLKYYASLNNGQYPTKTQWDDGSLKPKYLLSSEETLKKNHLYSGWLQRYRL